MFKVTLGRHHLDAQIVQNRVYHFSPDEGSFLSYVCFALLFIVFAGEGRQFLACVY